MSPNHHNHNSQNSFPVPFFVLFLFLWTVLIHGQQQRRLESFWIDSPEKAQLAGLRAEVIRNKICATQRKNNESESEEYRNKMVSNVEEMEELFEMDRAKALLDKHSMIGIDKRKLCEGRDEDEEEEADESNTTPPSSVALNLLENVERTERKNAVRNESIMRANNGSELANIDDHGSKEKDQKEKEVPIGIKVDALSEEGRESVRRMMTPEGEAELDGMLIRMETMARQGGVKPLPSSVLEPLLNRSKYDPRSAPSFAEGHAVDVRIGIHVQSIANFQLATMDYDMDMWLRMSWRDPRLAQNLSTPILINDERFLRKIWRPDAFFVNARASLFHRVTRLNFYAFVFPKGGEVFMEARLYVKPTSQLVLCKYPHDSQMLRLRISSIASTANATRYRWFSRPSDAIRMQGQLQLPELYIVGVQSGECQSARKTGNFSCLESRFLMRRSIGFHLWQTYVPTATCVVFSWISVWLPEEFVEGRVFVALTVFLTLSAESSSAKETLPKVSYVKAIDIWFGFTAVFVFFTMLQALLVIGMEHMSAWTRKTVVQLAGELSAHKASMLLMESRRYHRMARSLDEFCKVMYPVMFTVFLIVYVFVVIEGDEQKCIQSAAVAN